MIRTMTLVVTLAGCTVRYDHVNDIGGEMTVAITPVGAEGITVEATRAGMGEEELEEVVTADSYPDCASPRLTWALDTATSDPLWGNLRFCAPEVEVAATGCDSPVALTFEVDGSDGQGWMELDPGANGADFPVSAFSEFVLGTGGLAPSGSMTSTIALSGACIGDTVPHEVTLEWDFPVHDERSTRVPNELCCGPLVGLR